MTDSEKNSIVWELNVNGTTFKLDGSSRFVIGRKPRRPLEIPEGMQRIDIVDDSKSMSKTHAYIDVEEGRAVLSDAGSTNGTYVYGLGGKLLRIPVENPFTIDNDDATGQFGDVKFEIRSVESAVEVDKNDETSHVPNLFDLQEHVDTPAASLSVDDILDLRAGEPTSVFTLQDEDSAQEDQPADESKDSASSLFDSHNSAQINSEISDNEEDKTPQNNSEVSDEDNRSHVEAAEQYSTEVGATERVVASEDSGYMPVYEAGSVFDRLSRGEFDHKDNAIEAGGHTSSEAKTTRDFNLQFEIAQIPELLPFLSMNPFLYDDMYAWLVAQDNEKINDALQTNEGYSTWKASTK